MVSAEQLSREEVAAFLEGQPGTPEDLEALSGGAWSSAWAYRAGGEELVIRFGPEVSWYEADRMARAFAAPDLPVPEVRDVGTTPSGRAYAISVRHHGRSLEDTPVEQAGAITPTLTRLLVAPLPHCRPAGYPGRLAPLLRAAHRLHPSRLERMDREPG